MYQQTKLIANIIKLNCLILLFNFLLAQHYFKVCWMLFLFFFRDFASAVSAKSACCDMVWVRWKKYRNFTKWLTPIRANMLGKVRGIIFWMLNYTGPRKVRDTHFVLAGMDWAHLKINMSWTTQKREKKWNNRIFHRFVKINLLQFLFKFDTSSQWWNSSIIFCNCPNYVRRIFLSASTHITMHLIQYKKANSTT